MRITVTLANGKLKTADYQKSVTTIGRSPNNDFVISDESLSRQHAQISNEDGAFYVTDLGSTNGVYIDGTRIAANQKTMVNSFQQLTIGAFECQLEEAGNLNESIPKSSENSATQIRGANKELRPVNSASKPLPKTAKSGSSNKSFKIGAVLFLVAMGAGFYFLRPEVDPADMEGKSTDDVLINRNVPEPLRTIKDEFDDYLMRYSDKSCDNTTICKDLNLSEANGEGVVEKNKELFIFMNPVTHVEEPSFVHLKNNQNINEILMLYGVLKLPAMQEFSQKKIGQIHLIEIDKDFKIMKAYRFHSKYFASNEYIRMLTELAPALEKADMKPFWNYARPLIQIKSL